VFDLMEWLTGVKPLIPEDELDWQLACFEWLLKGTGGFGRFRHSVTVLPTDNFFPQKGLRFPALQEAMFAQIKIHAGMHRWPCRIAIQEADPTPFVSAQVFVKNMPQSPAGTFRRSETDVVITYNPALLSNPIAFVATLAHELAHFVVSEIPEPPPGGSENLEFATDMAAVFLGFGVFLLNSAFTYSQTTRYWSARRQGYLSEAQLLSALAIFTQLLQCDPAPISREIKGHFRRPYKLGLRDISKSERLIALRSIAPVDGATREIPAPATAPVPA
jgi:hypothetical protein